MNAERQGRQVVQKVRTEAFSDGVFAVAITLLVLEIKVPDPHGEGTLLHRLAEQWPSYAAYVVSFLTIGVIWINHHAFLSRLSAVDHSVMLLNILLLMTIVTIPFSTALIAEYLDAETGAMTAAVIYGGSFLLMAAVFWLCQWHALVNRPELGSDHVTPGLRRTILRKNAVGQLPYAVATAGALISPYVTITICALVAIFYALPATTRDMSAQR